MANLDLPMGLVSALETRSCVLFVGAGAGHNFVRPDGSRAPDATTLAGRLATRFGIDLGGEDAELAAVAELAERRKGRPSLEAALAEELDGFEPDEGFRQLIGRGWKAIYTTNYDNMIERCFELDPEPGHTRSRYRSRPISCPLPRRMKFRSITFTVTCSPRRKPDES